MRSLAVTGGRLERTGFAVICAGIGLICPWRAGEQEAGLQEASDASTSGRAGGLRNVLMEETSACSISVRTAQIQNFRTLCSDWGETVSERVLVLSLLILGCSSTGNVLLTHMLQPAASQVSGRTLGALSTRASNRGDWEVPCRRSTYGRSVLTVVGEHLEQSSLHSQGMSHILKSQQKCNHWLHLDYWNITFYWIVIPFWVCIVLHCPHPKLKHLLSSSSSSAERYQSPTVTTEAGWNMELIRNVSWLKHTSSFVAEVRATSYICVLKTGWSPASSHSQTWCWFYFKTFAYRRLFNGARLLNVSCEESVTLSLILVSRWEFGVTSARN